MTEPSYPFRLIPNWTTLPVASPIVVRLDFGVTPARKTLPMAEIPLQDSTPLVTGASRGVGLALLHALAAAGVKKIYAGARNVGMLTALTARIPATVVPVRLDVTSDADVNAAAALATDVDLVINNAGICAWDGLLSAPSLDDARQEIETNYFGPVRIARAFAPVLRANGGGRLVNVISLAGLVSVPSMGSYAASKAACVSATQTLRAELALQGTRVIAVQLGPVDTDMSAHVQWEGWRKVPPREIADAIVAGLIANLEDIDADEASASLRGALRTDPKAVEKQLAAFLPNSTTQPPHRTGAMA